MKIEIMSDIRNKLQAPFLILEHIEAGKSVPKTFFKRAGLDLIEAERLFRNLISDDNSTANYHVCK